LDLPATSAPGHVTVAAAASAEELDSMPINKLISDKLFVISMVQLMCVCVYVGLCLSVCLPVCLYVSVCMSVGVAM